MINNKAVSFVGKISSFLPGRSRRDATPKASIDRRHQLVDLDIEFRQMAEAENRQSADQPSMESLKLLTSHENSFNRTQSNAETDQKFKNLQPPTLRQLDILKHFKFNNVAEISWQQANVLIKSIFSDPTRVEQWNRRPPTSKVKQGILFMGGQVSSGMSQIEAQKRLVQCGIEEPERFEEWKHIENLFMSVNDKHILRHYATRKMTWLGFFRVYESIKRTGVAPKSINTDMIHRQIKSPLC